MGIAKQAMMEHQEQEALRTALYALLNHEKITNPVSVGIAKLVADKGMGALSGGQLDTWKKYIAPELDVHCEMCEGPVPREHIADALGNESEYGRVMCFTCLHTYNNMKDD